MKGWKTDKTRKGSIAVGVVDSCHRISIGETETMTKMTIKQLRQAAGMTQAEFAAFIGCPKRSLENWEEGKRQAPEYIIELIEYKLRKEKLI